MSTIEEGEKFKKLISHPILNYWRGAIIGSEQQHNQDLEEYIEGGTNSQIHHFLQESCIAFNQSALRHFLLECIAPRTTVRYRTVKPNKNLKSLELFLNQELNKVYDWLTANKLS